MNNILRFCKIVSVAIIMPYQNKSKTQFSHLKVNDPRSPKPRKKLKLNSLTHAIAFRINILLGHNYNWEI